MADETVRVRAGDLIEDTNLYPRVHIDASHVTDLVRALEAGATLPPLMADKASKRLVDGFHRKRAYIKVFGEEVPIPVMLVEYPNDRAIFAAAVAANSSHGRKLDRQDQIRVAVIGDRLGLNTQQIALSLNVTEQRVEKLALRIVHIDGGEDAHPAKRTLSYAYGGSVSHGQYDAHKSGPGIPTRQIVRQLHRLIETEAYDKADLHLSVLLHKLAALIQAKVSKPDEEDEPDQQVAQ